MKWKSIDNNNPNAGHKRVNIINKEKQTIMRTTTSLAERLVNDGTGNYKYCNKQKLKSFLNKEGKLYKNMAEIERIGKFHGNTNFTQYKEEHGKISISIPTYSPWTYEDANFERKAIPIRTDVNIKHGLRHYARIAGKKINNARIQIIKSAVRSLYYLTRTKKPKEGAYYTGEKRLIVSFG